MRVRPRRGHVLAKLRQRAGKAEKYLITEAVKSAVESNVHRLSLTWLEWLVHGRPLTLT